MKLANIQTHTFLITCKSVSFRVRPWMREGTVESAWFSRKSQIYTHTCTHTSTPLQLCVISPWQCYESNFMDWRRQIAVKKVSMISFPFRDEISSTSDHSQYLFAVSRLTWWGPSVHLWLWNWIWSCDCTHSVDNQFSAVHSMYWNTT